MAQLYRLLPDVKLPSGAAPLTKTRQHFVTYLQHASLPLMYWPNGKPCHLVNLWLTETAECTTGTESTKTHATLITPLIRFAFTRGISLYEFNDSYFTIFTNVLKEESKVGKTGIAHLARSKKQVLAIQHATLRFFVWLQRNHPLYDHTPLIGLAIDQPRIVIEWRSTPYTSALHIWHSELVVPSPPINDKFPMPEKYITKLRTAVYQRHQKLVDRHKNSKRHSNQHFLEVLRYLYSRRMFTINMMTNFGLRPQELMEMPIQENSSITSTLTIVLPTKKTRTDNTFRYLKITIGLAVTLQAYFDDRLQFIAYLAEHKTPPSSTTELFLGKDGAPLNKASVTKEFDRLCSDAELNNRKVCLSMFRHRFISREVKAELLLRSRKNTDLLRELTPSLRESVARTVMTKTGQRDPKSIWHYVDEQYKLLATPDSHESFQSIKDDLDQTKNTLEDLLFRQNFSSQEQVTTELNLLRDYIRALEERLYVAERTQGDD
ncbi:site-specific integrase [Pseudomonas frederiksbergensis]|uniref:Tyr recombinase domain-containing protein n=1 Tax=Pseudomonas frederiksbergensis TaxID=104087 RepID=A0A0B1Z964_9PSED|nr:site-specific integrase [Pseudomonas frederiksbergensis]KHK65903.1 hypothetical protein JZ00_03775 [Pseudomonas frederiksbergensis]